MGDVNVGRATKEPYLDRGVASCPPTVQGVHVHSQVVLQNGASGYNDILQYNVSN